MSGERVSRILCAAEPHGSADAVTHMLEAADDQRVQAIALTGDLGSDTGDRGASYRAVFKALGQAKRPTYWVPGPSDAPIEEYLREAQNIEIAMPQLHGVHGTAAYAPDGHIVFAGFGGEVNEDPEAPRDETEHLSYPRWEPEYRLKLWRELEEHQLVLLFHTRPAHKGHGDGSSEALAELVGTHRPRLVVTGGERASEMLGRSMIVAPGSLSEGHYAVVDLHKHEAEMLEFAAV
jgi:Icc-related predicted phosphoesterase